MSGVFPILARLTRRLRQFRCREDGAVLVEGLLILPLLLWAAFGLYVYWDAYRTINNVQKATYTVADAFSRLEANTNAAFAHGIVDTMAFLMKGRETPQARFTSVIFVTARNRFEDIRAYWYKDVAPFRTLSRKYYLYGE